MGDVITSGVVPLVCVLLGWVLARGPRSYRERSKIKEELDILERLPDGPHREVLQERINAAVQRYVRETGKPPPPEVGAQPPRPSRAGPGPGRTRQEASEEVQAPLSQGPPPDSWPGGPQPRRQSASQGQQEDPTPGASSYSYGPASLPRG